MKEVFIVGYSRTPIGKYGGVLSGLSAAQLGSHALKSALKQGNVSEDIVDEVYFGMVLTAGVGQHPAKQVALGAGLSESVPCTTVNKVCSSGMKAIMEGASSILCGQTDVVCAGGAESMSNVPFYLMAADSRVHRKPTSMGNKTMVDGMIKDGLWDVYGGYHMGHCAEHCAKQYRFTREDQDNFAIESFERAKKATEKGYFNSEISPITLTSKRGKSTVVSTDEGIVFDSSKLRKLRPAFDRSKDGSVTAGNASQLSDGAACVVLASKEAVIRHGLRPVAKILSFADAAKKPIEFTTAPTLAVNKALDRCGMSTSDLNERDYIELNEAFSVVGLANTRLLNLDPSRVNVFGGAVALGHPLGCSGARLLVSLCNQLSLFDGRYGVAGICNGGGGASAMIIQRVSSVARSRL